MDDSLYYSVNIYIYATEYTSRHVATFNCICLPSCGRRPPRCLNLVCCGCLYTMKTMITDQSTDDLLATRRKLAEVLSRHGSNPEDWLVSAEALSAPRQERIVRLYAELSENTDYFQRLANRAAAVPRTEPALRTYGPTDRDITFWRN